MKAKKKLLIGTLAAALVASGAGAVSTMAWFQTSITGKASGTNSGAITADVTAATKDSTNITFVPTFTVTPIHTSKGAVDGNTITGTGNMNLMAYHATKRTSGDPAPVYDSYVGGGESFAAGIYFGYVDGSGKTHYQTTQLGSLDYWRFYDVLVKVETQNVSENGQTVQYTAAQIETALSGKTWNLNVARNGENSIALFYGVTQTEPVNNAAAAPAAEGIFESVADQGNVTLKTGGAYTAAGVHVYFGLYIDGDSHPTGNATKDGDFLVTLSNSSNW